MSDRFPSALPYPWPIQLPFPYPAAQPFQQYVSTPQDIQMFPTINSSPRNRLPSSTYYPPQPVYVNSRECVPKREKKSVTIIDPNTKEEVNIDKNDLSSSTFESSVATPITESPKFENFKKQQQFRKLIATVAIKEIDRSPENKIKDEFKSKVSDALTPSLLTNEMYSSNTIGISDEASFNTDQDSIFPNFDDVNLVQETTLEKVNTMIFSNSLSLVDNGNTSKSIETEISNNVCLSLDSIEYTRDDILLLQPDMIHTHDIPSELEFSPFFCVSISEVFSYSQHLHQGQTNTTSIACIKSREKDKMNEKLTWILNRITPENYDKLSKKAIDLVGTAETIYDLESFIYCIFKKSINEPIYCEFYARLCNDMAKIFIREDSQKFESEISNVETKQVTFRRCLLTICQQEFEKDKNDNETLIQMKIKLESCTNVETKLLLNEEYQLKEKEVHKHSLGNVRLIGQLYRLNMLSENIIHECTVRLLKGRPTDDYLEELCSLFNVVGNDIDKQEAKDRIDQYFERIQHLMNRGFMSTRVKYLLMNLLDLRKNGWCERIEKELPKTLDELHSVDSCQSLPIINLAPKETNSILSTTVHKDDLAESLHSNIVKIPSSKLPSLKKTSTLRQFRPSGNWSHHSQDQKELTKSKLIPDKGLSVNKSIINQLSMNQNLSDNEIQKKSISILKEYDHLKDFEEVKEFIQFNYSSTVHSTIICGFFLSLNVTGGKLTSTLTELLVKCIQLEVISEHHLVDGTIKAIQHIYDDEITEDCPLIFVFVNRVLFPLFSSENLSLINLVNKICMFDNDYVEFVLMLLHSVHGEHPELLLSMIIHSNIVICDLILSHLKLSKSLLYQELKASLSCSESTKMKMRNFVNFEEKLATETTLELFCSNIYLEMKIHPFMKPMFLIEILVWYCLDLISSESFRVFVDYFASILLDVPIHFHYDIITFLLQQLSQLSSSKSLQIIEIFFSVNSIRNLINANLLQTIYDQNMISESIIKTIKSSLTT